MKQSSRYILNIAAGMGCISLVYFLSLVTHIPFIITAIVAAVALFFLCRWMNRRPFEPEEHIGSFAFIMLTAGVVILTNKIYYIATKHGVWDAWSIWNLHAKYLADPAHWQNMFRNTQFGHPDYPLALPAVIAFFSRLCGGYHVLISYAIHFLITLCIPVLIYLEGFRKSIIIAGLALILFATNEFYLANGVYQLADTMLAFYFLCALVCINHHKTDKRMLVLTAAFLGLCMWTKNEGVILAAVFMVFYFPELFLKSRLKYTAAGFALPFLAWLLFKYCYAPGNDIVSAQGQNTLSHVWDVQRYGVVARSFFNNLKEFTAVKWGVILYLIPCIWRKQWPEKQFMMLVVCLLAYMMIYVVTPYDMEWHLSTSQSRLMHQLMPAMMYVLTVRFSGNSETTAGFQAKFVSVRRRLQ